MTGRVFWIDEDNRIWETERNILIGLGFEVTPVPDATLALAIIGSAGVNDVRLIILDVMLLQGEDEIAFSDELTSGGRETGLVLAEKLCAADPSYGSRILFFSRVTEAHRVAKIKAVANKLGGFYLPKNKDTQGKYFISWLEKNGFIKGA
jgi:hypothetical protein